MSSAVICERLTKRSKKSQRKQKSSQGELSIKTVFGRGIRIVLSIQSMRTIFRAAMTIGSVAYFGLPLVAAYTATPKNLFPTFGEKLFRFQFAIFLVIPFFCNFGIKHLKIVFSYFGDTTAATGTPYAFASIIW